jgi:hypothetical protein
MSLFALGDDHDLLITANHWTLLTGADEVVQRLRSRLRAFRGEWFLNPNVGVPYYTEVFIKGISKSRIDAAFKREIITTPGVLELLSYDSAVDSATRSLTITFSARVTDGVVVDLTETVGGNTGASA